MWSNLFNHKTTFLKKKIFGTSVNLRSSGILIDEFRYELMATNLIPCVSVERQSRLNWMSGPLTKPIEFPA